MNGAKNWFFADGYLPAKTGSGAMESHEALMLFNTLPDQVAVRLDIYFSDRPPIRDIRLTVPGERVISLRLDHPDDIGGAVIPALTQYALRVRADHEIVVQFGRLDVTQPNLSYYVGVGYHE